MTGWIFEISSGEAQRGHLDAGGQSALGAKTDRV